MSLLSVAVYSFTGMLTIPKLMRPFQMDRGMIASLPRPYFRIAGNVSMIPESPATINATAYLRCGEEPG